MSMRESDSGQGEASTAMAEDERQLRSDSAHHLPASVPVIDLRLLTHPDGSCRVEMARLRSALSSWGVFQLMGHGIPTSFLTDIWGTGSQFFELPMEEKKRYACKGHGFNQGYGRDLVDGEADWTDRILLQVEPEDERNLELWPHNPTSFREILHEYSTRVKTVVKLILRAMAESLDLEETDYFISQFGEKMGIYCRCCHYPSSSRPGPVFGLRPHSDNSVISIISQGGDVEGLELLKDDQWIKVPTNPDVLLIMVGDLMEIMSNGRFKSSVHRVVAHRERERISTILFYMLDPEKEIGPPEELLKEGSPRMYRDLKVKDYLDAHLKSYSEGKRGIDWAKV